MEKTISFELVAPEQLVFKNEVGMIIVPGKDGDIGVLPGHSKLLSSLRPGRVMVYSEDKSLLKSFFVAEVFTGSPGKLVDLESTIKGFDAICKGEYDHLPEAAFYMLGTIEEAVEKAEKMAKEAAA